MYLFFVSISLIGASFKFFGKDFAQSLIATTSNPFVGLFIGVLATSLVQSSSTTTSIVVGMVGGGALNITNAIPIVIGANIGTSVTNTIVSLGHVSRPSEFRKAMAAATVHDFFNIIAVVAILPLQLSANILGRAATWLAHAFQGVGGFKYASPLKLIVKPAVGKIQHVTGDSGWIMLVIALVLLFISLRFIVVNLNALVIGKVEEFFTERLFKSAARSMMLGLVLTILVQSSSITTSMAVPLAGAGVLTLKQIFPLTIGANLGTTITGVMAAMVTGEPSAMIVAFAHVLFNVFGAIIIWPMRGVPVFLAERLAALSIRSRAVPLIYILVLFFGLPLLLITLSRL